MDTDWQTQSLVLILWFGWRQFWVTGHNQQLLTYKALFGSIPQIIQYGFIRFGDRFYQCCTLSVTKWDQWHVCDRLPAHPLGRDNVRSQGWGAFFRSPDRSMVKIRGLFTYQSCHFVARGGDDDRKPHHPFPRSLTWGQPHFNSILVPEQVLSKGGIESFNDCLVSVNIHEYPIS